MYKIDINWAQILRFLLNLHLNSSPQSIISTKKNTASKLANSALLIILSESD